MYLIGLLLSLLSIIFAIAMGSNFAMDLLPIFVDWPSIIIIKLALVGQIVATSTFKPLVSGINAIFSNKYYLSDEKKEEAISSFKMLSKTCIATGILVAVMGLIMMLHSLSDPQLLGPQVAIALMSIFYSVFISCFVLESAAFVLKKRKNVEFDLNSESIKLSDISTVKKLVDLCNKNGITPDKIKNATGIDIKNERQN